jgi:hypothetical protein
VVPLLTSYFQRFFVVDWAELLEGEQLVLDHTVGKLGPRLLHGVYGLLHPEPPAECEVGHEAREAVDACVAAMMDAKLLAGRRPLSAGHTGKLWAAAERGRRLPSPPPDGGLEVVWPTYAKLLQHAIAQAAYPFPRFDPDGDILGDDVPQQGHSEPQVDLWAVPSPKPPVELAQTWPASEPQVDVWAAEPQPERSRLPATSQQQAPSQPQRGWRAPPPPPVGGGMLWSAPSNDDCDADTDSVESEPDTPTLEQETDEVAAAIAQAAADAAMSAVRASEADTLASVIAQGAAAGAVPPDQSKQRQPPPHAEEETGFELDLMSDDELENPAPVRFFTTVIHASYTRYFAAA